MRNVKIDREQVKEDLTKILSDKFSSMAEASRFLGYKNTSPFHYFIQRLSKPCSPNFLLQAVGLISYLSAKIEVPKKVNYNAVYSVSVIHYNQGLHQTVKYIVSDNVKIKEITQTRVRPYHLLIEINRVTIAVFNPVQVAYK